MKPNLLSSVAQPKLHKLILVAVVFIVYLNVLPNGYNLDDNLVTQHHPLTSKGISSIGKIFTSSYYSGADLSFGYRPVTHLTFAIEHQLFGEHAAVSHLINLLLFLAAVLLFYQLISQWVGTGVYTVAFLAALIFAVHPVHTEVVASIKNRDELLAFVFMLLAARYVHRFVEEKKWHIWFLALLFFGLGMLSKKSIYPVVFVFPLIQVMINRHNVQQMFVAALSYILPAAVIGSDFVLSRCILLFFAPLAAIAMLYACMQYKVILEKGRALFSFSYAYLAGWVASWAIIVFAFLHSQIGYVLLAVPFVFFTLYRPAQIHVLHAIFQLAVTAFLFTDSTLGVAALITAIGYSWYTRSKREGSYKQIIVAVVSVVTYLYIDFSIGALALLLNVNVFFFLLHKRPLWAVVFSAAGIALSYFLFKPELYLVALLIVASGFYLYKDRRGLIGNLVFFLVAVSLIYVSVKTQSVSQLWNIHFAPNEATVTNGIVKPGEAGLTEGRSLHYIENSLVAPHSKAEAIATGFLTLGEYMRLMVLPNELSFYYGYARLETTSLSDPFVWLSIGIHLALLVLAIVQFNTRPLLRIGIAWYLVCVLLFSNWIELVAGMVGERLVFTASAGFCLFIAATVMWLKPGFNIRKPQAVEYAVLVWLVLFAARTIARNNDWKDTLTLMEHDIEHLDRSAYAQHAFGATLMHVSTSNAKLSHTESSVMQQRAVEHFNKSVAIYPYFFNAHFDLARVYIAQADYVKAKDALLGAYAIDSTNLFVLEELAKTSFELKQADETEKYANLFLAKEPLNENVHEVLAYIMLTNNRKADAKKYAERGLQYFPGNRNLQIMLKDAQK